MQNYLRFACLVCQCLAFCITHFGFLGWEQGRDNEEHWGSCLPDCCALKDGQACRCSMHQGGGLCSQHRQVLARQAVPSPSGSFIPLSGLLPFPYCFAVQLPQEGRRELEVLFHQPDLKRYKYLPSSTSVPWSQPYVILLSPVLVWLSLPLHT